jgi:hypothetical protein
MHKQGRNRIGVKPTPHDAGGVKRMKFRIKVKNENPNLEPWWETYNENTDDPVAYSKKLIEGFNNFLRPHESPRTLLSVEVLQSENTNHEWVKLTNGQSIRFRGNLVDLHQCSKCGITGKRYGLNSVIKIDSKYRAKKYRECKASTTE